MPYRYRCPKCEEWHVGFPDIGYASPQHVSSIPEAERSKRLFLTSDLCVIDDEDFFIRCVLLLPVQGIPDTFGWGVWSTLSETNFLRYRQHYDEDMSGWAPMFGYLSNKLPDYPDTLNLHVSVQPQEKGARPHLTLNHTDHPLYLEQQNGIALDKVLRLVESYLHE